MPVPHAFPDPLRSTSMNSSKLSGWYGRSSIRPASALIAMAEELANWSVSAIVD